MILPKIRDPRFITVRRGGTLQDDVHRLLAVWAADCAQHVLHHFEQARPTDDRPRRAIDLGRAWARGEISWAEARTAAGHANAAARDLRGAARHAAYAAGQAAAVGHVAAHELGAAAYAIRAARAAAPDDEREVAGRLECQWQRGPAPRRDPRSRARRPAAAQRAVLVRVRLLTRARSGGRHPTQGWAAGPTRGPVEGRGDSVTRGVELLAMLLDHLLRNVRGDFLVVVDLGMEHASAVGQ